MYAFKDNIPIGYIYTCMYRHVEDVLFLRIDIEDNLSDGDELCHAKNDGKNYFDMKMLDKAENAVCLLS